MQKSVKEKNVKDTSENLKELVDGCIAGKRRYQERFFKAYYGKMMAVCMRYIHDHDTAQEIVQEGFIKVFDKLATYDFTGSFDGWMRRIFANMAIDSIRKTKREAFVEIHDTTASTNEPMGIELDEMLDDMGMKADTAMRAIEQLSTMYKTVFNLYVFENYSHKEIADLLNISEGTSKSNFFKAKANLRKILEKEFNLIDNR
jgi:RNA polymerase sigma factor (sigma-70 family)